MKKSYIYIVFLIFLFIVIVPNSTLVPQSTTTAAENLTEMRRSVPKSKDRLGDHVCTWKRSEQFRPEGICYSLLCLGEEGVVVGW